MLRRLTSIVSISVLTAVVIFPMGAFAADKGSEVQVLDAGGEHPPIGVDISKLAWLAGYWRGTGLGSTAEEIWLDPVGGVMSGTFRLSKPGGALFYEIMTLGTKSGVTAIRLKHFHPSLEGWEHEERTDVQEFPLLRIDEQRFHFDGMTLVHHGDTMDVHLKIADRKSGKSRIELFRYQRIGGRTP